MAEEKQNNVNEESPYVIDLIDEDGNTVPRLTAMITSSVFPMTMSRRL